MSDERIPSPGYSSFVGKKYCIEDLKYNVQYNVQSVIQRGVNSAECDTLLDFQTVVTRDSGLSDNARSLILQMQCSINPRKRCAKLIYNTQNKTVQNTPNKYSF